MIGRREPYEYYKAEWMKKNFPGAKKSNQKRVSRNAIAYKVGVFKNRNEYIVFCEL